MSWLLLPLLPPLLLGICVLAGGERDRRGPAVPDSWVAVPAPRGSPDECWSFAQPYRLDYRVQVQGSELQITREPSGRTASIPRGLEARMDLELGYIPRLQYVFEYPLGWLAIYNRRYFGHRIEWWARSLDDGQSIPSGDAEPWDTVRAARSGDVVLVLQERWWSTTRRGQSTTRQGQLVELRYQHDHFTSRAIAQYESGPRDMFQQADGSWLVLTDDAVWHTSLTGTVELVARLPSVPQNHTTLLADDVGQLYVGGNIGVLRLTPSWDAHLRYIPYLLLPKGFPFERCSTDWTERGRH